MGKKEGSFGMIALVVVMGVVLLLVASAWQKLANPAIDVTDPTAAELRDSHQSTRSGDMSDVHEARRSGDQHAADVDEALASID